MSTSEDESEGGRLVRESKKWTKAKVKKACKLVYTNSKSRTSKDGSEHGLASRMSKKRARYIETESSDEDYTSIQKKNAKYDDSDLSDSDALVEKTKTKRKATAKSTESERFKDEISENNKKNAMDPKSEEGFHVTLSKAGYIKR